MYYNIVHYQHYQYKILACQRLNFQQLLFTGVDGLSAGHLTQLPVFGTINGHALPVMTRHEIRTPSFQTLRLGSFALCTHCFQFHLVNQAGKRSDLMLCVYCRLRVSAATCCNELKVCSYTQRSAEVLGKVYQVAVAAALEAVGDRRWIFMTVTFGLRKKSSKTYTE